MQLLARLFLAAALLASGLAARADFAITNLTGLSAEKNLSLTYITALSWSSGTTITGSVDIGTADTGKEIFLTSAVTAASGSPTLTAASTTVNGTAVTKCTTSNGATSNSQECAFVYVPTAAGSVTITATYSATLTSGRLGVYRVLNRPNRGNNQTDAAVCNSAGATSCAISTTTISGNGIWFAVHMHQNTNATTSPTDTVADLEATVGTNRFALNSRQFAVGTSVTPTDTWSWTGSVAVRSASWAFQ
jgi:hypothetical protein